LSLTQAKAAYNDIHKQVQPKITGILIKKKQGVILSEIETLILDRYKRVCLLLKRLNIFS